MNSGSSENLFNDNQRILHLTENTCGTGAVVFHTVLCHDPLKVVKYFTNSIYFIHFHGSAGIYPYSKIQTIPDIVHSPETTLFGKFKNFHGDLIRTDINCRKCGHCHTFFPPAKDYFIPDINFR